MTHEDYVSYEQAELLKELGFDWECSHGYYRFFNDKEPWLNTCGYAKNSIGGDFFYCAAPTLSQTQKWLREVKDVILFVDIKFHKGKVKYSWYIVTDNGRRGICDPIKNNRYEIYEEALSTAINRALKLLKERSE